MSVPSIFAGIPMYCRAKLRGMVTLFVISLATALSPPVLLVAEPAFAQVAQPATVPSEIPPAGGPSFTQTLVDMLPMFAMVYVIFYVLVTRPAQQKQLALTKLMEELKKGDLVVTKAGLIGRVAAKEKDHILLEAAPNTKLKFELSAIAGKWDSKVAEKTKPERPERTDRNDKASGEKGA